MGEDTVHLVIKITLSSGEVKRHSYTNCPCDKDAFSKWWRELMGNVFSEKGVRDWVKLQNPTVLYHEDHIAMWEFECEGSEGSEEVLALIDKETDFMLRIV